MTLQEVCTTRDAPGPLRLRCPAKVNLSLEVLGRRPDGYHELRSVMVPLSLADDLELRLDGEPGVRLHVEGADLPAGPDNLVHRAATLFLETVRGASLSAGRRVEAGPGVEVRLTKRIPVGAGLGGGSSDAAATLVGLDRLLGSRLGEEELARLALRLGADVPFFVRGRAALATGVGERLEPLSGMPTLWMVLVNPGFPVSTADTYRAFDAATGGSGRLTPAPPEVTIERFLKGPAAAGPALRNDLETVTLRARPGLAELKRDLTSAGATGAVMSGSGPTVFGIFLDEPAAREAHDRLRGRQGRLVLLAHSV